MKTFFVIFITIILASRISSQWRDFPEPYLNEQLNSICVTSNLNMFVVGGNKLASWHIGGPPPDYYEFDINSNFNSIYFSDESNGFAVGVNQNFDSGILIKSTDGGNTWTNEIQILGSSDLNDVFFINNSVGWIAGHFYAGDQAIVGKSTDGGITWSASTIPYIESGEFYAIHFADVNIGWAAGTGDGLGFGKIIKTTDSGNNWIDQPVSITGTINDLDFINSLVGWICTSNGEILKTSDGGSSWISQYSNSESINSISFLDESYGWGVGDNGLILYTINGGINWFIEESNSTSNLYSIFTSSNLPYGVSGSAGKSMLREIFSVSNAFTPMDGSSAVGDYDNDGDLDIALTGVLVTRPQNQIEVDELYCEIYRNNGNGSFSQIPAPLTSVADGSMDWGDYDNDGDLDLLLSGFYEDDTSWATILKIYRNDGNDLFTELLIPLNGFDRGFLKWGDLDNDGDLDIMSSAGIYSNEGGDSFAEKTSALSELGFAAGTLGDMDNDGDIDIITGLENSTPKIFSNNGEFNFTEIALPPVTSLKYFDLAKLNTDALERYNSFFENSGSSAYYGSCDIGDYDNDGDLDILWIQTSYSANGTIIYRNDGNDNYTELTNSNLPGLMLGSGVFIDYDNDGYLDVFLSGGNTYNDEESGIYRNDGNDTFVQVPFYYGEDETISWSSTNSGDFDNDGDVDLLVVGEKYGLQGAANIYSNNCLFPSSLPTVPSSLQSQINYRDVTLNWNKSSDNETPQVALNYNIYLGTSPNGIDIVSPMSVVSNGYRGIVNQGNTNHNNIWTIKGLSHGTYYWSVQAIDNNFAGSPFAIEQQFTIGGCDPGWIAATNQQYNMSLIGLLKFDDLVSLNEEDVIGAFVGSECRGIASPIAALDGKIFLTISSDQLSGETVTFKAWRSSTCELLPVLGTIDFVNQGEVGTLADPYLFNGGMVELIYDFGSGYSWLSVNINPGNMGVNTVLNGLNASSNDRIIGQTSFAVYDAGSSQWVGSLLTLDYTQMYIMKLAIADEFTLQGLPVNPTTTPISLNPGYSWINYLPQTSMPINTALENMTVSPSSNDRLIGQTQFAVYDSGSGQWVGSLLSLDPGVGYKLKLTNATVLTYPPNSFVPTNSIEPLAKIEAVPDWAPLPNQQYNMQIIGEIVWDGVVSTNPNDIIGAFVGTECKGVASPIALGVFFLTVGSNQQSGEAVTFKVYHSNLDQIDENPNYPAVPFANQGEVGTLDNPFRVESPIPVELTSFTAVANSNAVSLKWQTATEINNYGFDVERKTDSYWQKIGFVQGNGNSISPKEYLFTDNKLVGGSKYQYRIKQIDNNGQFAYSAVVEVELIPNEYALYQNYPNPFNPTTKIRYHLPVDGKVVIKVYNILGSEVMQLLNEQKEAGIYEVEFNAETLSSGTYIYKINANNFVQTKKLILLK